MPITDKIVTMVAKKDYKSFESAINTEVEAKLKAHLSGFTNYLEKNAFQKEED